MAAKRPTYTWKYVPFTAAAPLDEKRFRSKPTCYAGIEGERELIREGVSRVTRAVVYEWDRDAGRWMTSERLDLKSEVEREQAARKAEAEKEHLARQLEDLKDEA